MPTLIPPPAPAQANPFGGSAARAAPAGGTGTRSARAAGAGSAGAGAVGTTVGAGAGIARSAAALSPAGGVAVGRIGPAALRCRRGRRFDAAFHAIFSQRATGCAGKQASHGGCPHPCVDVHLNSFRLLIEENGGGNGRQMCCSLDGPLMRGIRQRTGTDPGGCARPRHACPPATPTGRSSCE